MAWIVSLVSTLSMVGLPLRLDRRGKAAQLHCEPPADDPVARDRGRLAPHGLLGLGITGQAAAQVVGNLLFSVLLAVGVFRRHPACSGWCQPCAPAPHSAGRSGT